MRVARLQGALLDYWVAQAEGLRRLPETPGAGAAHEPGSGWWPPSLYHPSTNWTQGGIIVSGAWCELENRLAAWFGPNWLGVKTVADEPLAWLMRAYVATRFGDEVDEAEAADSAVEPPAAEGESRPVLAPRRWSAWLGLGRVHKAEPGC